MTEATLLSPVLEFASHRVRSIASSAIHKIQRMKASGSQGADYDLRTLWNEYSWEIQNGDGDLVGTLVEDLVTETVESIVAKLPDAEATLLTCAYSDDDDDVGLRNDHVIITAVLNRISAKASSRNLERLDPDYRWYENL